MKYYLIFESGYSVYESSKEVKDFKSIKELNEFIETLNDYEKQSEMIVIKGIIIESKEVVSITKIIYGE